MMAIWIIVGVVVLLLVATNVVDGGDESRRKSTSVVVREDHHSVPTHAKSVSLADSGLSCTGKNSVDLNIVPELVAEARRLGYERFPVLGACAPRKCIADNVVKGTVFSVCVGDGFVWVVRDNGTRIGCFPPSAVKSYMEMPESKRYAKVVVVSDVNLNDKYGQCFVYPVASVDGLIG